MEGRSVEQGEAVERTASPASLLFLDFSHRPRLTTALRGDCSVKQVSKGYFHDYNSLRQEGGKAFIAPKTLIREDVRPLPLPF